MESKSLGIIGGMGPKATSVFFDKIIESTDAHKDQEHMDIVVLNHATLPDRTSAILNGEDDLFLDSIRKDIEVLEKAGVSNIAIPCNTSHYFYDKIQAMTDITIINMVEETMKEITGKYGRSAKIGIMATNGTIQSDIYRKVGEKYDLEVYYPELHIQEQIMDIIYNKVKSNLTVDIKEFEELVFHFIFKQQCDCVILACTELSCITLSEHIADYCVDAMEVLVRRSIEWSGKHVKSNAFDRFLSDSFAHDVYERELRLSEEEVAYTKKRFPKARINPLSTEMDSDGKRWYEVCLSSNDHDPSSSTEKEQYEKQTVKA
jgi:aspartate racemase